MGITDKMQSAGIVLPEYLPQIDTGQAVKVLTELGILRDVLSRETNHLARAFILGEFKTRLDEAVRQWQIQTAGFRNSPQHRKEAYETIIRLLFKIVDRCDVTVQSSVNSTSRWLKQLLWLMKTAMAYSMGALLDEDHERRFELELIKAQSLGQVATAQGVAVKQEGLRRGFVPRIKSFFGRLRPGGGRR